MASRVRAWGVSPGFVERLRKHQIIVEEVENLPDDPPKEFAILMLGVPVAMQFIAAADAYEERHGVRPSPTVLYTQHDECEPRIFWEYRDAIVRDDDWSQLSEFIECPQLVQARVMAADVSTSFLLENCQPIEELDIEAIRFDTPDPEMREHLKRCVTCRMEFETVLAERTRMESRDPGFLFLRMNLTKYPEPQELAKREGTAVFALCIRQPLLNFAATSSASSYRSSGSGINISITNDLADMTGLLEHLRLGERFSWPHHRLHLRLSDTELFLERLEEYGNQVSEFQVRFFSDGRLVDYFSSQEGVATIPLNKLSAHMQGGADRMEILSFDTEDL